MKHFTAFFVALVLCLCTIGSSTSTFNVAAKDISTSSPEVLEYLKQFETPYYDGNFDFDNDERLDVFDLAILKKKCESSEDGVTIHTVEKFQNWLLAKTDANLRIKKVKNSHIFNKASEADTQAIQNLLSNDFRLISDDCKEVNGIISLELSFLGIDETKIEKATFQNFSDSTIAETTIIAETDCFFVTIQDEKYVLSFKEDVKPSILGLEKSWFDNLTPYPTPTEVEPTTEYEDPCWVPAIAKIDLISAKLSDINDFNNFVKVADSKKELYIDNICKIVTVDFSDPSAEVIVVVPLSTSNDIHGTVLYYCDEFIIFYSDEEEGFRISIKQ